MGDDPDVEANDSIGFLWMALHERDKFLLENALRKLDAEESPTVKDLVLAQQRLEESENQLYRWKNRHRHSNEYEVTLGEMRRVCAALYLSDFPDEALRQEVLSYGDYRLRPGYTCSSGNSESPKSSWRSISAPTLCECPSPGCGRSRWTRSRSIAEQWRNRLAAGTRPEASLARSVVPGLLGRSDPSLLGEGCSPGHQV